MAERYAPGSTAAMVKVHQLLDSPDKWCRCANAKSINNINIDNVNDPMAVRWCLSGAINKCYSDSVERCAVFVRVNQAINARFLEAISITLFNDISSYETVLKLAKELDI